MGDLQPKDNSIWSKCGNNLSIGPATVKQNLVSQAIIYLNARYKNVSHFPSAS